jgi:hypothetical protein
MTQRTQTARELLARMLRPSRHAPVPPLKIGIHADLNPWAIRQGYDVWRPGSRLPCIRDG